MFERRKIGARSAAKLMLAALGVGIICLRTEPAAAVSPVETVRAEPEQGKVILHLEKAQVELQFLELGVVKVEVFAEHLDSEFETQMTLPDALAPVRVELNSEAGELAGPEVRVRYSLQPLRLEFFNRAGKLLLRLLPGGVSWAEDGSYRLVFRKEAGDRYFGLGEPHAGKWPWSGLVTTLPLDYNGHRRRIWGQHLIPPADVGLPFFLNPNGYGLMIANPVKARFDFTPLRSFRYRAQGGPLRFYYFSGPALYSIINAYSRLTGRTPMPPAWVTGYMQCRYGYKDEKDFRWLMENFRSKKLPCDVLIFDLDWFAYGDGAEIRMGELRWSPVNFPNYAALQKDLHEKGFKTIVILEPHIWTTSSRFNEVRDLGLAARTATGEPYLFRHWGTTKALLLDFNNPAARAWFGDRVKEIHETGVDAWWTDLNEPETDHSDMVFGGRPQYQTHNLQALLQHRGMAEMYRREFPNQRLFIMSRSSFVGDWRYGAGIWSGDVKSSWGHLANQVPIGISAGLSGWGLWNSDVGGFSGKASPELFTRWMEFGAFSPIFRAHGAHQPREPWAFGEAAEKNLRQLLELRYRLSPYLYTTYYELHASGKPPLRAMFLEFPDDPRTYQINDQFMFGPWLLVAPVTKEGARERKVYLPRGEWTDFWTDEVFTGGRAIRAPAPLERIPLFVRQGAVLPLGPVMQYIGEQPLDPLTLHIYPGQAPSSYQVYNDDGVSNDYLQGQSTLTTVQTAKNPELKVTVFRQGRFRDMVEKQSYLIVFHHLAVKPAGLALDGQALPEQRSGDEPGPGWSYDSARQMAMISLPLSPESFTVKALLTKSP